ncbi:DUF1820 family protein [Catenovulum maritimum]|uniref:DUF1820 domain-containing protein n=1 Tax=Catenovulum maritimum TaxID=1513271 RepID=A0A0J8GTJ3_9ALTE|nr:DUF1820 family protein [Catenovulum maritimum]KMT64003.1 hypothetical protein XM47_16540 [Catenovulum maritimum]
MSDKQTLYRVSFINNNEKYEVYVRRLTSSNLFGFIEIGDFVWNNHSTLVLDTSEEKLKSEFEGVELSYIPMHSVLKIDQVKKSGTAKISSLGDKVTHLPKPIYTPKPQN